jgi:hypothetical protein
MASHHKHHMKHKKARGGGAGHEAHREDDDVGSPEMHEARAKKRGGKVHGHKGHHRIHKKRGGGVGSDHHPFSSAYTKSSEAT